jgi:anti-sigma regulatory factor (Ser/Thr protein kinase)
MDESESEDSLYIALDSDMAKVSLVLERVDRFARRQGYRESDALLLVVRELLMNAIVHGNEAIPSRIAFVRVARRGMFFEVQVDDEGEGFDSQTLDLDLPDNPQYLTKRGLVLVHELSEELIFERGGSRVRAIVDPDDRRPDSNRGQFGYAEEKSSREESCTSPMGKSL